MSRTAEQLIELCYGFYPRDIAREDPRHDDKPEHLRLVAMRRKAGEADSPWIPMLRRLRTRFQALIVENLSPHLPTGNYDGGYSGQLYYHPMKEPGQERRFDSLDFHVSFLAPYYLIYSHRRPTEDAALYTRHPDLLPIEEPYARAIAEEIEATFPGYAPLPPEVGELVVPGVATGLKLIGEATLYDCLFTDAM